jgi:hypothetical protein
MVDTVANVPPSDPRYKFIEFEPGISKRYKFIPPII